MIVVPPHLWERLVANSQAPDGIDHIPVVKFFDPAGAATWLITEVMEDQDSLFGLCDLGFGSPELGYVSLTELKETKNRLSIDLERDLFFSAILEAGRMFESWTHAKTGKKKGGKVFIAVSARGEVTFHEGYINNRKHNAKQGRRAARRVKHRPLRHHPKSRMPCSRIWTCTGRSPFARRCSMPRVSLCGS